MFCAQVEEIAFINSMMESDRKLVLQQKLEESQMRRRERLAAILQQQAKAQACGGGRVERVFVMDLRMR